MSSYDIRPESFDHNHELVVDIENPTAELKLDALYWRKLPEFGLKIIQEGELCSPGELCVVVDTDRYHYLTIGFIDTGAPNHPNPQRITGTKYYSDGNPDKPLYIISAEVDKNTGKKTAKKVRKTSVPVRAGGGNP